MRFLSAPVGNSVIFQILLAMLLIAGMALASMGLSVYDDAAYTGRCGGHQPCRIIADAVLPYRTPPGFGQRR